MGSPGRPIADGLANTFRYLPQHTLDSVLGPTWGPRVEGWMGMSPAPDGPTGGATPVAHPDPNYQSEMLERANQSFRDAQKPSLATMKKSLPQSK